ncbi:hypothetical protein DY000_02020774 [Brassica cretica]|uniref:Uncharacterized protein n=1 Tax=Brassica cretica TaxID=69181 RepID=A0ABQ7E0S2_BRACR|nr:hypothetical protein DY000_02020774 [Brassica cretica]
MLILCCSESFGVSLESLRAEGDLYRWLGGTISGDSSTATARGPVGNLLQRRSTFAQWQ